MKHIWRAALMAALAAMTSGAAPAQDNKVETAIALMRTLERPGRINLATVGDGNKYIQCRLMPDANVRCEAAGTLMQPSLEHILTPDRVRALVARGWTLDSAFGNYARMFKPDTSSAAIADELLGTLSTAYGADTAELQVETSTVADEPCPPRNGWTQNLAGMIDASPAMKGVVVHACSYVPGSILPEQRLGPGSTMAYLIAVYGSRVGKEIERLRLNVDSKDIFVVFDTQIGYVQCTPETAPDGFYCEAQSADSWPALAAVLTSERISRLHAAGYADPGRSQNYSRSYRADGITDAALAADVLAVLHDVYGYYGASKLEIVTEDTPARKGTVAGKPRAKDCGCPSQPKP
jgi:hypothetical protein